MRSTAPYSSTVGTTEHDVIWRPSQEQDLTELNSITKDVAEDERKEGWRAEWGVDKIVAPYRGGHIYGEGPDNAEDNETTTAGSSSTSWSKWNLFGFCCLGRPGKPPGKQSCCETEPASLVPPILDELAKLKLESDLDCRLLDLQEDLPHVEGIATERPDITLSVAPRKAHFNPFLSSDTGEQVDERGVIALENAWLARRFALLKEKEKQMQSQISMLRKAGQGKWTQEEDRAVLAAVASSGLTPAHLARLRNEKEERHRFWGWVSRQVQVATAAVSGGSPKGKNHCKDRHKFLVAQGKDSKLKPLTKHKPKSPRRRDQRLRPEGRKR